MAVAAWIGGVVSDVVVLGMAVLVRMGWVRYGPERHGPFGLGKLWQLWSGAAC